MLRHLTIGVLAAVLLASTASPAAAHPDHSRWRGPCDGWQNGENDTAATAVADRQRHTRNLVVCVFNRVSPGDLSTALYVANRESHFFPDAANPSGCLGVYQHQQAYWAPRAALVPRAWLSPYLWSTWSYGGVATASPFNPYVNVWATAIMVRSGGWAPWAL